MINNTCTLGSFIFANLQHNMPEQQNENQDDVDATLMVFQIAISDLTSIEVVN